jgi:hypothetical protein
MRNADEHWNGHILRKHQAHARRAGIVYRQKQQSEQIKSFGNIKTPGLSAFFGRVKWTIISTLNSAWTDKHKKALGCEGDISQDGLI